MTHPKLSSRLGVLLAIGIFTIWRFGEAQAQIGIFDPSMANSASAKKEFPNVALEIVLPKKRYALGEAIEVTMRYTNGEKRPFKCMLVSYDRSGRIMDFGFSAQSSDEKSDKRPIRDPNPFLGGVGGGIRGERILKPGEVFEQKATVNEWLAFDKPGTYQLNSFSGIISTLPDNKNQAARTLLLTGAPVRIEIAGPDEASRLKELAAAKQALGNAQKILAKLPANLEDYQRGEKIGQAPVVAVTHLRWMLDGRAIPLLVQSLEMGSSLAFHGYRGLEAFQDKAPVRAAIIARLKMGEPVLEGEWAFKQLLINSRGRAKNESANYELTPEEQTLFNSGLRAAFARSVRSGNKTAAASVAAQLLSNDPSAKGDARVWRHFWAGVSAVNPELQWKTTTLLDEEKSGKRKFPIATPDLKTAALNLKIDINLRSAAVQALGRRGDFSMRPFLAVDILKSERAYNNAAMTTLGNYRSRDIAVQLLKQLKTKDDSSVFAKETITPRFRDFGKGATLAELVAAERWMIPRYTWGQGPLLEAIALRDQHVAFKLILESLAKSPAWEYDDRRLGVLVRLSVPEARLKVRGFLNQKNENFLISLVGKIGDLMGDYSGAPEDEGERRFLAKPEIGESLLPELALIYSTGATLKLRNSARDAILACSHYKFVPSSDKAGVWEANLNRWWLKNAERLGRETKPLFGRLIFESSGSKDDLGDL